MRAPTGGVETGDGARQMRASDNAGRDRLAVQPFAVTGDRLNRVRESVAEIQKRASVRFFFARIVGDDCQFVGDRAGDGETQKTASPEPPF